MSKKEKFLCLGFPQWRGDYMKSTVKLISGLAKYYDIIYVDYQFTWKDVLWQGLIKKKIQWRRIIGMGSRFERVQIHNDSLLLYTPPPILPVNFIRSKFLYHLGLKFNSFVVKKNLNRHLRRMRFTHPVVVNAFNPFLGIYLKNAFKEKILIYYCYDEINAAKWMKKHGGELEIKYLRMVDVLITTSSHLLQSKITDFKKKQAHIIYNGVDFKLFNKAFNHKMFIKTMIISIGYVGSLDDRLDYELINELVITYPEYQFHFVGRVTSNKAFILKNFSNVRLIGPVPYEEIPNLIKGLNIMIIPFVKSKFTQSIYPMKINEYLAAGKPVISTDFADLSEFKDIIEIASTKNEFIQNLNKDKLPDLFDLNRINKGINIARENNWDKKVFNLYKIIEDNKA